MPRSKGDKPTFSVDSDVPTPQAVVASAAAALQRGDYANATKAAVEVVDAYYGYDVWALDDGKVDRKIRYVADLIGKASHRSLPTHSPDG